jgi:hypothetical protein
MRLVLLMILALGPAHAAEASEADDIGYPTVAAAFSERQRQMREHMQGAAAPAARPGVTEGDR